MSITKKTAASKPAKKIISRKLKTVKNDDILSSLKLEILNEVSPILKTLSMPKIKKEVSKEFNSILELEFVKLKSEFDSKHKKSDTNLTKILSNFELKLLDGLKNNSSLKKQFDCFQKNTIKELENNLEEVLSKKLSSIIESTISLHKKSENDIDDLKKSVSMLEDVSQKISNKTDIEIREGERKHAQFLVNKVNEVVDKVNEFEDDFKEEQKKTFGNFELNIDNQFEQVEKKIRQELLHRVEIELQANHQDYSSKENSSQKDLNKFKNELSNHVKEYILSLDKELKVLTNKESTLSLKEKDFMTKVKGQINNDVSILEIKLKDFKSEMKELSKKLDSKKEKKVLNDEIKNSLDKSRKDITGELIIQSNYNKDELTRVNLSTKENVKKLTNDVENKLFSQIENFKNLFDKELLNFSNELGSRDLKLEKEILLLSNDREGLANERSNFNEKFSKLFLESKSQIKEAIIGINNSNKDLKGTVTETVSKKLGEQVEKFNKRYDTNFLKFEKKVGTFEWKFEKSLNAVTIERELLAKQREEFEGKFDAAVQETQLKIDSVFSKFEIENKDLEAILTNVVSSKLNVQIEEFEKTFNNYMSVFDDKLQKQEKILSSKIGAINSERELMIKERDDIHNQVLDVLESSKKDINSDLIKSNEIFDGLRVEIDDSLARQVMISSDQLEKIKEETYLFRESLKSEIENKLIKSTKQNDDEFNLFVNKFENQLKVKEEDFIKKLLSLEVEKNTVVDELKEFKADIAGHTKVYIESLDAKLNLMKVQNINLKEEKDVFVGILEDTTKARKKDIENFGTEVRDSLGKIILGQEDRFEKNESTFRNTFNEKINNLHNFQKKKLESIEKKFVDKNLKFVEDRVEKSLDMFKTLDDEICSKVMTIDKKVDQVVSKEDMLKESVVLFENRVNEKIETRMIELESKLTDRNSLAEQKAQCEINDLAKREREFMEDRVEQSLDMLNIMKDDISTRVLSIDKKFDEVVSKEDMLAENVALFEKRVNERVEIRMIELESELNARSLAVEEKSQSKVNDLAQREREFVEDCKNLEIEINERVESRMMALEQSFNSRMLKIEESNTSKVNKIIEQENDLVNDFTSLEIELKESSEERIMGLEQSVNKRVLYLDEDFSNFKRVVIEELEDLLKEVNTLMTQKVDQVDSQINKFNYAGSEIIKRFRDFDLMKVDLSKQITFMRDELSDLRVKQDILPNPKTDSTNLITNMSEYEQNLVQLIDSLKKRGISDEDILHTLLQKGHPQFYVSMIIKHLSLGRLN